MNEIWVLIANNIMDIVFALIGLAFTTVVLPWVAKTAIPWLKEKHIYSLVSKFVKAAEKRAEAGTLAKPLKKEFVINLLKDKGIEITAEVDAFIEAAVNELDTAVQGAIIGVGELMEAEDGETEAPPEAE